MAGVDNKCLKMMWHACYYSIGCSIHAAAGVSKRLIFRVKNEATARREGNPKRHDPFVHFPSVPLLPTNLL